MNYYHITNPENKESFLQKGIRSDTEGKIIVFDNNSISDYVAMIKLYINPYTLFEIDSDGILGKIENAEVGEITAKHKFIIYQEKIDPKYVKLLGEYEVDELEFMQQFNELVYRKRT
jgi:hypothetical protein